MTTDLPDKFLELRVDKLVLDPPYAALCAGFEGGAWRSKALAYHIFNWLPFAALNQEHQLAFGANNFVDMLRLAAAHVYKTKKTVSRGEIGELLLHLACVQHFGTAPVLCKLVLKTSHNDTVKGFDAVHVLPLKDDYEVWLGESKFYSDPRRSIRDAVTSIKSHLLPPFLSTEKAMIYGHIGHDIPHRDQLTTLFKAQTSSDELLAHAVFPVLIAYNSQTSAAFGALSDQYVSDLTNEVEALKELFAVELGQVKIRVVLIFVPLATKQHLVENFDKLLEPFL
jgi:hypothetical protein